MLLHVDGVNKGLLLLLFLFLLLLYIVCIYGILQKQRRVQEIGLLAGLLVKPN